MQFITLCIYIFSCSGGLDFELQAITLAFLSGLSSQIQCNINIQNDSRLENEESFIVSLVAEPGINISPAMATVTIIDDDG